MFAVAVAMVSSVVRKTSFVIAFRKMLMSLKGEKSLMRLAHEIPAPLKGSSLMTFLYVYRRKTFHFIGLKGIMYELEFVGLILKSARFLKMMTVSSADIDSEDKFGVVLNELLMLPRESRTSQTAFS